MDKSILARSVNLIKKKLPKFNDDLLIGLRKREFEGLMGFITECYQDYIKVVNQPIEMLEPFVVSPAERLQYELDHTGFGGQRTKLNVNVDEANLVRFDFKYNDQLLSKYLYLPYIYEDSYIIVNGTRHNFQLNISEALFSVRNSQSVDMKVIRVPLRFIAHSVYLFRSESSDKEFSSKIIVAKIHNQALSKSKKDAKPTIILYLLAKFGLKGLLQKLGYRGDEIGYASAIEQPDVYEYIRIQNVSNKVGPVMATIRKDVCNDSTLVDIVAIIQYSLGSYRNVSYFNLTTDDIQEYLLFLGKAIRGRNTPKNQAHRDMQLHLASTDNYLDSYYKAIFARNGVIVDDIYDLLIWMWNNIGDVLLKYKSNDMFNKRVDCINNLIIDIYFRHLYGLLYKKDVRNSPDYMMSYVADVLGVKVSASFILKRAKQLINVRTAASIYNDNWLLSIGAHAIKGLGGTNKYSNDIQSPTNRYHPSMLVIESAVGFSSTNPSINFYINPYAVVDQYGGFVKTPFAKKVFREMAKFLPN